MISKTTHNIQVSVTPEYDHKNSYPSDNRFVFRYHITIENLGEDEVKLLKREWLIYDVGFGYQQVAGDGVIGLTPVIKPGESFTYFSNVMLHSGVGHMKGTYLIVNLTNDETFEVEIPKFQLHSEVLSN